MKISGHQSTIRGFGIVQDMAVTTLLAAFALISPLAHAGVDPAESGLYLGGGIGYNRVESENFPDDNDGLEDDHVGYKGIAGVRLSRMFSIEGQYVDFGTSEDGDNRVEADGWTVGALLAAPVFHVVNPYAKAGALFWDAESRTGLGTGSDDDGTDFAYGLGLRFHLAEALALRTEYERFALDETDVDLVSANLAFGF